MTPQSQRLPALFSLRFAVAWAVVAAVLAALHWPDPLAAPMDADSLLRLVQVRDLVAGQGWYDLIQHRLQPPAGLDMHWSRLLDAPMLLLSRLFGEHAMLYLWPLSLVGGFLAATVAVSVRVGGGSVHALWTLPVPAL